MTKSSEETPINQKTYRFRPRKKAGEQFISRTFSLPPETYKALMAVARKERKSTSKVVNEVLLASGRLTAAIKQVTDLRKAAQERMKYSSMDLYRGRRVRH